MKTYKEYDINVYFETSQTTKKLRKLNGLDVIEYRTLILNILSNFYNNDRLKIGDWLDNEFTYTSGNFIFYFHTHISYNPEVKSMTGHKSGKLLYLTINNEKFMKPHEVLYYLFIYLKKIKEYENK